MSVKIEETSMGLFNIHLQKFLQKHGTVAACLLYCVFRLTCIQFLLFLETSKILVIGLLSPDTTAY